MPMLYTSEPELVNATFNSLSLRLAPAQQAGDCQPWSPLPLVEYYVYFGKQGSKCEETLSACNLLISNSESVLLGELDSYSSYVVFASAGNFYTKLLSRK
ncbi:unnamed protein product, partial [Cyprideis torosa]